MGDFDGALVIWELTQACGERDDDREFTTAEAYAMLARIAAAGGNPRLVLTGGDPLKRPDLFNIIRRSVSLGLHTTVKASATPLLTHAAVARFKHSGAACMAVGLHGANSAVGYSRTLGALRSAVRVGLETQVDTTLTRRNAPSLTALSAIVARERARRWSVSIGRADDGLTAEEYESTLAFLHRTNLTAPFEVEVYGIGDGAAATGGRRLVFVSHTGEIATAAATVWRPLRCSHCPHPVLEAAC